MKEKFKRFIVKKLVKILEWFSVDENLNDEIPKEKKEVSAYEETDNKEKVNKNFFGNDTLFDKVKEIELEIFPLKNSSLEYYQMYKEKLNQIVKNIKKYYEEQEIKDEFYLKVMTGADYSIQLQKELYNLLNEIKCFKREKFNFKLGIQILESTKEYLYKVYLKLVANSSDVSILDKAYKTLNCKLEEIYNLDIEKSAIKQEEMCKMMCECIYIFFKCNCICNNHCDISNFKLIFQKEKNTFWDILLENATDLLNQAEILKNTKYYERYEPYLRAILDKCNIEYEILLNEKFLKNFVLNEKKVIELHYYYMMHKNESDTNNNNSNNLSGDENFDISDIDEKS